MDAMRIAERRIRWGMSRLPPMAEQIPVFEWPTPSKRYRPTQAEMAASKLARRRGWLLRLARAAESRALYLRAMRAALQKGPLYFGRRRVTVADVIRSHDGLRLWIEDNPDV